MRRFQTFGPAFVVLLTAAVTLFAVPGAIRRINSAQTNATVTLAQRALDDDPILERLNQAIRNVAEAVEPSVVHLEVRSGGGRMAYRGSSGSGWVYDGDGHIVTNAHVVAGATAVLVQFYDGRVVRGEVTGLDPVADIAVVRVEPGDFLIPARRATGLRVQRGDRVFAFGSPFGFKFSMSEGIVSGLGRSARTALGSAGISNFIQTDAAVNPGNSGGPLVDARGRVVGMNVAIATAQNSEGSMSEGQSAGISFAIPLATIESRAAQVIEGGPVRAGFLGISFAGFERLSTEGFVGRGVEVGGVQPGGAAERAGLRSGDVITAIDGEDVTEGDVLRSLISSTKPGETVRLRVLRNGETLDLPVTLGQMPADAAASQYQRVLFEQFGLTMRDTDAGPTIDRVWESEPASAAGFEAGQRLRRVGEQRVDDVQEAITAMLDEGLFSGRSVSLEVVETTDDGGERVRELELRLTFGKR